MCMTNSGEPETVIFRFYSLSLLLLPYKTCAGLIKFQRRKQQHYNKQVEKKLTQRGDCLTAASFLTVWGCCLMTNAGKMLDSY